MRTLGITGGLLAISVVLLLTGVHRLLFSHLIAVLEPWRADRVEANTLPGDGHGLDRAERLIRLNAINIVLRRRLREYEDLRRHRDIYAPREPIRSRILARHTREGRHYLEIDAGATDGVRRGSPVLAGWSLIGLVAGERARQSAVQLLTDLECEVPVAIYAPAEVAPGEEGEAPRFRLGRWIADGVARGTGSTQRLKVVRIEDRDEFEIEPGMQVLTSGLANRLPAGLVVGTVRSVEVPDVRDPARSEPDDGMRTGHGEWRVEVQPLRPWGTYHTVLVLVETEGRTAAAP